MNSSPFVSRSLYLSLSDDRIEEGRDEVKEEVVQYK